MILCISFTRQAGAVIINSIKRRGLDKFHQGRSSHMNIFIVTYSHHCILDLHDLMMEEQVKEVKN